MTWCYRVFKNNDGYYGFIEVYTSLDGQILTYTDFISPGGSTQNELELDLEAMAAALNKPVLTEADLFNAHLEETFKALNVSR